MSAFFKSLGSALWSRVVLGYKSTLIGLGLVVADVVLTQVDAIPEAPAWVHGVVGILATLLAFYKGKGQLPVPQPVPVPVKAPENGSDAAKAATK